MRWTVGLALRNLGRTNEAPAMEREPKAELDTGGEHRPYVDDELALLEAS